MPSMFHPHNRVRASNSLYSWDRFSPLNMSIQLHQPNDLLLWPTCLVTLPPGPNAHFSFPTSVQLGLCTIQERWGPDYRLCFLPDKFPRKSLFSQSFNILPDTGLRDPCDTNEYCHIKAFKLNPCCSPEQRLGHY